MIQFLLSLSLLFNQITYASKKNASLITEAESSGWKKTGRYEEVDRLCHRFEKEFYRKVRCQIFGVTPEGRKMFYLVVGEGARGYDPDLVKRAKRPVILFQGGIHAGEIDGKDAGFWFLRQVLEKQILIGVLSKLTLVFVPVFNVDGHERFGKYNRPNQVGPEEMGWRVTSQNLNLNRDYAKADSPEMNAMLRLLKTWDPILYLDLHVTDGAQFQHDVSVIVHPSLKGVEPLRTLGEKLSGEIMEKLKAKQHLPLPFYPSFIKDDEPESGFDSGIAAPRFSQGYWSLHNRIGVLVETHSWKDYATRVRATRDTLESFADLAMRDGALWMDAAAKSDAAVKSASAGQEQVLLYEPTKTVTTIDFQGVAYRREKSKVSGVEKIIYDPSKPEVWKLPYYSELAPKLSVKVPLGGYLLPRQYVPALIEKLKNHQIEFVELKKNCDACEVETFRPTEFTFAKKPFEGRFGLELKGEWKEEKRDVLAGALFIPSAQASGRLLVHLFEPLAPDSLLSWGFFNSAFEHKEYMEAYVTEAVAEEMLKKDPKLEAEFKLLLRDEAFAKDPERRLEFFYRRHSSWDERFALYPVLRLQRAPGNLLK